MCSNGIKLTLLVILTIVNSVKMQNASNITTQSYVQTTTAPSVSCVPSTKCVFICNNATNTTTASPTTCNINGTCCNCTISLVCVPINNQGPVNPGPPPAPQSGPNNAFANVDPRICFVLSNVYPSYTPSAIATLASSRDTWGSIVDALTISQWSANCKAALQYYIYLEDLVVNGDNNVWVTYTRLYSVLKCKPDCNFNRLLSMSTIFNSSLSSFLQNVSSYMTPKAAQQCRQQFPSLNSLASAATASSLASNPSLVSIMTPAQMGAFSSADSLSIAQTLTQNGKQLSSTMAKSLGANIQTNQSLSGIASIASGVPLAVFSNTAPDTLANLVGSMDLDNMNSFRKGFIATKIASSNNASVIQSLLQGTSDSSIVNSIPAALFSSLSINITAIPAANLPKAYLKSYARTQLASASLSSITDSSLLGKLLPGITKSDLTTITDSLKVTTISNLVSASYTNSIALTSSQRSAMLSSLLNSLSVITGSTNASVYLANLTSTQIQTLCPLFIEANSTVLAGFSTLSTFSYAISKIATLSSSQCCYFTRSARKTFASYAAPYLFSYTNLALSDLYQLGPCLVSTLPIAYLRNISSDVFGSYYPTLGSSFQPDSDETTVVTKLITALAANASSQDTLVFSTLSDLALYYNFSSTYANSLTSSGWTTNGASLMSTIKTARDPTDSSIQVCQLGLTNSASLKTSISSYGTQFVSKYIGSIAAGKRKKRAATALTCSQLNDLSSSLNQLSVDQLAAITNSEFYSCQTLLGTASNSWSSSQLTQLAATAKSYYVSASSISDTNIAALNSIMVGFSSTDLATITFTTTTSIAALGALSEWSADQLTALGTPLTKYINSSLSGTITSDFITSAANLMCSLTSTQINAISSSVFSSSVTALAKISLTCPNIATWYTYAKATTTYSSLLTSTSALTELGSIIAGITTTDISSITADSISSISTTAWQYMPAATVNSLSLTQLAGLSNDQITALANSPNYASFSSTITASLTSLSSGGSPVTVTSDSSLKKSCNFLTLSSLVTIFIFNFRF